MFSRLIKVGDKVLFLGEMNYIAQSDEINEYDIQNNKWNELKIRLPVAMYMCIWINCN